MKRPEDLAGVPISVGYQSGSHYSDHPGARAVSCRPTRSTSSFKRRHGVRPHGASCSNGKVPACSAVQRAVLLRRAARLPQGASTRTFMIATMITGDPATRRTRRRVLPRPEAGAGATSTCGRSFYTKLLQERVPGALSRQGWIRAAGGSGRAHRVRALFARDLRGIVRLDPRSTASSRTTISARLSLREG